MKKLVFSTVLPSLMFAIVVSLSLDSLAAKNCRWLAADQFPVALETYSRAAYPPFITAGTQKQVLDWQDGYSLEMTRDLLEEQNIQLRMSRAPETTGGLPEKLAWTGSSYATSSLVRDWIKNGVYDTVDKLAPLAYGQDASWNAQNFAKLFLSIPPHASIEAYQQVKRVTNFVRSGGQSRSMRGNMDAAIFPAKNSLQFFLVRRQANKLGVELWNRGSEGEFLELLSDRDFPTDRMSFGQTAVQLDSGRLYVLSSDGPRTNAFEISSKSGQVTTQAKGTWPAVHGISSITSLGPSSFLAVSGLNGDKHLFEEFQNSAGQIQLKKTRIQPFIPGLSKVVDRAGFGAHVRSLVGLDGAKIKYFNAVVLTKESISDYAYVIQNAMIVSLRPDVDGEVTGVYAQSFFDFTSRKLIDSLRPDDVDILKAVMSKSQPNFSLGNRNELQVVFEASKASLGIEESHGAYFAGPNIRLAYTLRLKPEAGYSEILSLDTKPSLSD